jgi:hypothetical protein
MGMIVGSEAFRELSGGVMLGLGLGLALMGRSFLPNAL